LPMCSNTRAVGDTTRAGKRATFQCSWCRSPQSRLTSRWAPSMGRYKGFLTKMRLATMTARSCPSRSLPRSSIGSLPLHQTSTMVPNRPHKDESIGAGKFRKDWIQLATRTLNKTEMAVANLLMGEEMSHSAASLCAGCRQSAVSAVGWRTGRGRSADCGGMEGE